MGLIINKKITPMMVGYPTVSDKYNVSGAILAGSTAVNFGDLVKVTSTPGYFEKATSAASVDAIAGFVLATNVKVAENWPGTTVQVNPGEAFNLMIDGFIAVELDTGATSSYVTPNAPCYVILATGKVTTSDKASAGTVVQLPNCVFTGYKDTSGSAIIAEVYVK